MAYGTFTLTGAHQDPTGTPHAGSVLITPNAVIRDSTGDVILSGAVKVTLDAAGHWSIVLPADDPTLSPSSGLGYRVTYRLHSSSLPSEFVAAQAAGTTLDMADVVSSDPTTATTTLVGPGVPTGGTTGQVLAKASATDLDTEWVDAAGGSGSSTAYAYTEAEADAFPSGTLVLLLDPTEVVPETVTFADPSGTEADTYTIPVAPTGVAYKIGGSVVAAGTYPGTGAVTVTADVTSSAYAIAAGATSEWTYTFTAGGGTPPTFVGSTAYSSGTGSPTAPTIALPVGSQAGDIAVIGAFTRGTETYTFPGTAVGTKAAWRILTAADITAGLLTVTLSVAGRVSLGLVVMRGQNPVDPIGYTTYVANSLNVTPWTISGFTPEMGASRLAITVGSDGSFAPATSTDVTIGSQTGTLGSTVCGYLTAHKEITTTDLLAPMNITPNVAQKYQISVIEVKGI